MEGTFNATNGTGGATGKTPRARLRFVGLCLTAMLGSILVLWASRTTWNEVGTLGREFGDLKADDFYLGVKMRSEIQRLNETLLRYRLRGEAGDAEAFRAQAAEFNAWLNQNAAAAVQPLQRQFFRQARAAYDEYQEESALLLQRGFGRSSSGRDFTRTYERVQRQSETLLRLCDLFIDNQRSSFSNFIRRSQGTLEQFQNLLQISFALVLVLAVALVGLVYRGMIAPLQVELSETRAEVARQEKLASLGVLAAGVAHEIRNPLTAIKFRLFSLKKSLPAELADQEDVSVIAGEISRLERIVRDFLQFARPSDPVLADVPVRQMLGEVAELLRPQLEKESVILKVEDSPEAWVRADAQQIKQVLLNLIRNSADSIERNGLIILRVRQESGLARQKSEAVIIDVADNGKGMPPEVQKRLFDPFFTTKEGGTGLGLPIAARIIQRHGGELRYQTEMRRGATFSIVLPKVVKNETESIAN